jgi:integrase/recombinase XerC
MNIAPLVNDFLRHIKYERNLSHHTISQYRRDLDEWLKYLEQKAVPPHTGTITVEVMRGWMQDMAEAGRQVPTVTRKLCCFRSFWKFIRRYHNVDHDPMSKLITPRQDRKLPATLKQSEVMRLFRACDESYYRVHRVGDKAVLAVLACLGLRRQELIDIRVGDLNFEDRTLLVRSAKRGRERLVPLTDDLIALIRAWLSVRAAASNDHLFVTRHGNPLTPGRLGDMLRRLASQAGLERRPRLHMFRHYAGTAMVQQGGIERARRLLGHQRPETTAIYSHLSVDDLRPAVAETGVYSGMAGRSTAALPPPPADPGTEMAVQRLGLAVQAMPAGWRQREPVLRDLVTRWTAETAGAGERAYAVEDVGAILWSRATVAGLTLDDHMVIVNFGNTAWRYLTLCEDRPPQVQMLDTLGQELSRGLLSVDQSGEGGSEDQLARVAEGLDDLPPGQDLMGLLTRAARLYTSLQPFRVDIPRGQQAIGLLIGLFTWSRGLPPIVVPAAERLLWELLLQRLLMRDNVLAVAYAAARLAGLVQRVETLLLRG